ncbi:MAG: DUF4835 family protein [Candidatus Neomarinimicrobiota bacterium]
MKSLAFALVMLVTLLPAQFLEVTVQLDVEWLSERERQELQGIEEAIRQFYLHSPWDQDIEDLDMVLDMQLVFQSTIDIGNEIYFQAQVLFNNRQDQRYFVRDATFLYSTGRSINLSPVFEPLASFLEFYAYVLIAGELDTYEILAGSPYYTRASNLAIRGVNDPYVGRGWGSRDELVRRLTADQDIRRAKAYFYQALETLAEEEPDMAALKKLLDQFYGSISAVVKREGQERYLSIFLSGHAEETAEMLARAGMWRELAEMQILNPDSEHIYRGFLEEAKKGS